MARRRQVAGVSDGVAEVVAWYRDKLDEPAVLPWEGAKWQPVVTGPTWQVVDRRWVLPEFSLGWEVLGWSGVEYQHGLGRPWRYTLEQARFILWWYAVDGSGRWLFRDGVLQRLKGWGKDPMGACLMGNEAFGPCRFADWDRGLPVATDEPQAWVQTAAVALEQTKNTMRLFPSLFTPEAVQRYGLQIGRELVHGLGDTRLIQAVTSSPRTLEGARATAVVKNETHHWLANNEGHEMAAVIERNATKSEGGAARTLAITNAYEPSAESVAQMDREAWEAAASGESLTTGILYDSLEAPADAPLTAEDAPDVVRAIRGDSVWLDPVRIVQAILDTRNPPSRSRRFWYNQIVAAEDAWVVPDDFNILAIPNKGVGLQAEPCEITLFFDGSKSDDATALVGVRIEDGHVLTLGMWQRPPGRRGEEWLAPRAEVDRRVDEVFEHFSPRVFWADPSHTKDDVTQERYWDGLIDQWHQRYKDRLDRKLWAQPGKHSIMWDMASPKNVATFTAAAERTVDDIESAAKAVRAGDEPTFTWDGDGRLRTHVHNAREYPGKYGISLWKGHRESPRKVDLAVCMVGARMLRRDLTNTVKKRTGRAAFY